MQKLLFRGVAVLVFGEALRQAWMYVQHWGWSPTGLFCITVILTGMRVLAGEKKVVKKPEMGKPETCVLVLSVLLIISGALAVFTAMLFADHHSDGFQIGVAFACIGWCLYSLLRVFVPDSAVVAKVVE